MHTVVYYDAHNSDLKVQVQSRCLHMVYVLSETLLGLNYVSHACSDSA